MPEIRDTGKDEQATPGESWPSKDEAQKWEIQGFIDHYRRLSGQRTFAVVRKQERPDWIVRDVLNGELIGVELTPVYLDDWSVPDRHRRGGEGSIPYRKEDIAAYGRRVAAAVRRKALLARDGYDTALPLVLSVYANEYVTIHMGEKEWQRIVQAHKATFDGMRPFSAIVVWPLVNGGALRIRPTM
jgi:hypothetical protein